MWAARNGNSTLGIPKSVAEKFVDATADLLGHPQKDAATPAEKIAAGVIHRAPDGSVLLLKRSADEKNYGGHWSLPGGGAEDGETPEEAACRECEEEIGRRPEGTLELVRKRLSPTGVLFHTFENKVDDKFTPTLNAEHSEHAWATADKLPEPMHPQVRSVLMGRASAADAALAFDDSVRTQDLDGRLHVAVTNISKAAVNEYRGEEIPGWIELGLDPARLYKMFRDPAEIAKAVETFNGLPLMRRHVVANADDHKPDLVIGATGTDAEFVDPFLRNSLVVWVREDIDLIQSGRKKEISSSYYYKPVMVPGEYMGQQYDGRMTEIHGSHVAIVFEGRAGPNVAVADSMENLNMSKAKLSLRGVAAVGALVGYLSPKLAADAKIDLIPAFDGVNNDNYVRERARIVEAVTKIVTPKLAADAKIDGIGAVLAAFDDTDMGEDALMPNAGEPPLKDKAKDKAAKDKAAKDKKAKDAAEEFLKSKLSAEDKCSYDAIVEGKSVPEGEVAGDESEEEKEKAKDKKARDKARDEEEEMEKEKERKGAMDAAITEAVSKERKHQRDLSEALQFVRPWVGELPALTFDSADDVYRKALVIKGVKGAKDMAAAALRPVLENLPKAGASPLNIPSPRAAQDSAGAASFASIFGDSPAPAQA